MVTKSHPPRSPHEDAIAEVIAVEDGRHPADPSGLRCDLVDDDDDDDGAITPYGDQLEDDELLTDDFMIWLPRLCGTGKGWSMVRRLCCVPSYPDGLLNRKARGRGFVSFSQGRLQVGTSRWSRRFDVDGLYWQAADLACDVSAWRERFPEGKPYALSLVFFGNFTCSSIKALIYALPDSFWRDPIHVSGVYLLHDQSMPTDIWYDQRISSKGGRVCRNGTALLDMLDWLLQTRRVLFIHVAFSWSSSPGRVTLVGLGQGSQLALDQWLQVPSSKRCNVSQMSTPHDLAVKSSLETCEETFAGRCPELWLLGCIKGDPDAADVKVLERLTKSHLVRISDDLNSQDEPNQDDAHPSCCPAGLKTCSTILEHDVLPPSSDVPGVLHSTFAIHRMGVESSVKIQDFNSTRNSLSDFPDVLREPKVRQDQNQRQEDELVKPVHVPSVQNNDGGHAPQTVFRNVQQWLQDLDDSMLKYFEGQNESYVSPIVAETGGFDQSEVVIVPEAGTMQDVSGDLPTLALSSSSRQEESAMNSFFDAKSIDARLSPPNSFFGESSLEDCQMNDFTLGPVRQSLVSESQESLELPSTPSLVTGISTTQHVDVKAFDSNSMRFGLIVDSDARHAGTIVSEILEEKCNESHEEDDSVSFLASMNAGIHSIPSACFALSDKGSPCSPPRQQPVLDENTPPPPPPSPQYRQQLQQLQPQIQTRLLQPNWYPSPPTQHQPQLEKVQQHQRLDHQDWDSLFQDTSNVESHGMSTMFANLQGRNTYKLESLRDLPTATDEKIHQHMNVDTITSPKQASTNEILDMKRQQDIARWQKVMVREAAKYNEAELLEMVPFAAY